MTTDSPMTTAATLIAYRQELIDAGLGHDEIVELVREANVALLRHSVNGRSMVVNVTPSEPSAAKVGKAISDALNAYYKNGGRA